MSEESVEFMHDRRERTYVRSSLSAKRPEEQRLLQDAAYRVFKENRPEGTPSLFVDWLENVVDWSISLDPEREHIKLTPFGDRTAVRIFARNRIPAAYSQNVQKMTS